MLRVALLKGEGFCEGAELSGYSNELGSGRRVRALPILLFRRRLISERRITLNSLVVGFRPGALPELVLGPIIPQQLNVPITAGLIRRRQNHGYNIIAVGFAE